MASNMIKGLTVEIGGDTTKLGKALQDVESKSRNLSKELGDINRLLKYDPGNVDLLAQKQAVLASAITETKDKLETLRQAEAQVQDQFARGEVSAEQVRALQREIVATEGKLKAYEGAASDTADALERMGKSGDGVKSLTKTVSEQETKLKALKERYVDVATSQGKNSAEAKALKREIGSLSGELNNNKDKLSDAEKSADKFDKTLKKTDTDGKRLGDTLKGSLKAGLVALTAAMAAAGAAAVKLGQSVVTAYADYEQLVGGVDTLFKSSSDTVQKYAANAYKTAGLSANQYMETVTSFSAALISSLGGDTEKAAKYADMAITDMSDNANKMGTSMSDIEHAYQGFAKQNYTMLDNLKLGYGGTKEEMQRLLEDATAISGIKYDVSSYADVVSAIHVIQQNMGIAGATAKEAETTISGSLNSFKAALQNLVVGFGDANANIDMLVANVVNAFSTVVQNITPVIENIVNSLPTAVQGLLTAFSSLLPSLISTATNLITQVLHSILAMLPSVVSQLVSALGTLVQSATSMIPQILTAGIQIITTLLNGMTQSIPKIVQAIVGMIPQLVQALVSGIPQLINGAVQFFLAIIQAIPRILPPLISALPKIITTVINALLNAIPQLLQGAVQFFLAIVQALPQVIQALIGALPQIIQTVVNFLVNNIDVLVEAAITMFMALVQAIPDICEALVRNLPQIIGTIVTGIIDAVPKILEAALELGAGLVKGLWQGVQNLGSWLWNKLTGWVGDVVGWVADKLGIHSPSTVARDYIGKNFGLGVAEGVEDSTEAVERSTDRLGDAMVDGFGVESSLQRRGRERAAEVSQATSSGMAERLDKILTAIKNGQVLLIDGKTLVGYTDNALGKRQVLAARGAL